MPSNSRLVVNGPEHGKIFESPLQSIDFPISSEPEPGRFQVCRYHRADYIVGPGEPIPKGSYSLWVPIGTSTFVKSQLIDAVQKSGFPPDQT